MGISCAAAPAPLPKARAEPAPSAAKPVPPPAPSLGVQVARFGLQAPQILEKGSAKLDLWATHYYLPHVRHDPKGHPLRDPQGRPLGPKLSAKDWCEAAMEGSIRVHQNNRARTFNFSRTRRNVEVDCKRFFPRHPAISRSRFRVAAGAFGDGVGGRVLVPFRTVAVDPKKIPLGTVVFIPAARGATFRSPEGEPLVHDGFFLAGDIGGAIKGVHIDVYTGTSPKPGLPFIKSRKTATFEAYLLQSKPLQQALEALHRPKR